MKDLIVLVPGEDDKRVLSGLLTRYESLRIREVSVEYIVHGDRDSGCLHSCAEVLRSSLNEFRYALVMFDREESDPLIGSADVLESRVKGRLTLEGWRDRVECVVIDPELEAWVWSGSPRVEDILGWKDRTLRLRAWLETQEVPIRGKMVKVWPANQPKPSRPKEAMELSLRRARLPRSSARFEQLAQSVSLKRCEDRAFLRLREILKSWFGLPDSDP